MKNDLWGSPRALGVRARADKAIRSDKPQEIVEYFWNEIHANKRQIFSYSTICSFFYTKFSKEMVPS